MSLGGRNNYSRAFMALALACMIAASFFCEEARSADSRFVVSYQTVKDVETGVVWSRDGNPADRQISWDDAQSYIDDLNKARYGGYSDWKLPDVDQVRKLAASLMQTRTAGSDGGASLATILNRGGFENVQTGDYWSDTTNMYNDTEAWYVSLTTGKASTGNKTLYFYVWPVRRGQ